MSCELIVAVTTVETEDDAQAIAQALVGEGLAACVQIERIDSVYRWAGTVQQSAERRLLVKTTAERWPALQARIRELHPYELPAVYAWPVTHADAAYADWVLSAVAG